MTQRTLATLLAVPLLVGLVLAAAFTPLPYTTYAPGMTVDVLGEADGEEIIQVDGHEVHRDEGELRMTTVFVSVPGAKKDIWELMATWLDEDKAVYPYIYDEDETEEQNRIEGEVDMVTSQDRAVAVALTELGYDVRPAVGIAHVDEGAPADGRLEVRDLVLSANGRNVTEPEDLREIVTSTPEGEPVRFVVRRGGERREVSVVPRRDDDGPLRVGVTPGTLYRFPFEVDVNIDPEIGGPSAGLMFSLAIYDTLTPGSLTGGRDVAGTGTLADDGRVGPIGGIQQKVAGARRDGADLFLVPPDNCAEALGADAGDMELVRADTMHDARLALEAWSEEPDADLPRCEK